MEKRISNASSIGSIESKLPSPDFEPDNRYNSDDDDTPVERVRKKYNKLKLDEVAEIADRMNFSLGGTAMMVTATLNDVGE